MSKLYFASDYQEGAHPEVLRRLVETNLESTSGYGTDDYCLSAADKIRKACDCPGAEVHFLIGGTQTNATLIDAMLASYQGVLSASSGHIAQHEAGAIEWGSHKVLTLPEQNGKISADSLVDYCRTYWGDEAHEHIVMPGMVYISQPTECGSLYTLKELEAIRKACDTYQLKLYLDGARLAYALACSENDVTLPDLARLCDAFYIGGTKCGCLFGEALVLTRPNLIPHLFTIIKQHGALLAKGRLLGLQFDALFTENLYDQIGQTALRTADTLRRALLDKGYTLAFDSPTNQIFVVLDDAFMEKLREHVVFSFWEKKDDTHTVVRFATSWATTDEDVQRLIDLL